MGSLTHSLRVRRRLQVVACETKHTREAQISLLRMLAACRVGRSEVGIGYYPKFARLRAANAHAEAGCPMDLFRGYPPPPPRGPSQRINFGFWVTWNPRGVKRSPLSHGPSFWRGYRGCVFLSHKEMEREGYHDLCWYLQIESFRGVSGCARFCPSTVRGGGRGGYPLLTSYSGQPRSRPPPSPTRGPSQRITFYSWVTWNKKGEQKDPLRSC